jgi:hypothetical protein
VSTVYGWSVDTLNRQSGDAPSVTQKLLPTPRTIAEEYIPSRVKDSVRRLLGEFLSDQVVTYRQLRDRPEVGVWPFGVDRTFTFTRPTYANELPDEIARLTGEHQVHQPFVLEVPNVTLVGWQGMKRTTGGEYIVYNFMRGSTDGAGRQLAYDVVDGLSDGTWPFGNRGLSRQRERIDHAVPLLHRWARNYSHWTEEHLTQIEAIRHYTEQTGEQPTILVPPDPPAFVPDSLELLGFSADDYREFDGDRLHVRRLVLPSVRRSYSDTSDDYFRDPYALQWLRREVLDTVEDDDSIETPSKLLISRERDATVRRITNWDAVESALAARGFETVVLTELSFVEQKRLFRGADVVVATHGAGLTELVYAEDAAVVELFGSYVVPAYYEMAQAMGHRYGCLVCEPVGDDLSVDVSELLNAIDRTVEG